MGALDALDRRILAVLQEHGDITNAELAERVSASPASCWRRSKALEADGLLGPCVRLLEPERIGLGLDVLCQVRMTSHEPGVRAQFEAFVASHDNVMSCYSMSGEWDYLLRVVVGDVRAYERFLMQQLLSQPGIATCASHFALKRVKYKTALPV